MGHSASRWLSDSTFVAPCNNEGIPRKWVLVTVYQVVTSNFIIITVNILPALEQLIYLINFDFIIKKALKYFQAHSELFYHDKCPGDSHCSLTSRQCVLSLNLPASLVVCVFMCSKYLLHKIFLPNNQLLQGP